MIEQAYVVKHDSVLYLVLHERQPVSARRQRDGYLQRESVFVAGREKPDPTGRVAGRFPVWLLVAECAPAVSWNGERNITGPLVSSWRHPTGCGRAIYAVPGSGVPRPDIQATPMDSYRISDWARDIILFACTQACSELWVLGHHQPESPGDVQELWSEHVIAVSRDYLDQQAST